MKKRPRQPKPLPPVLASATGPALIKHLASCNTSVRSHSLRLILSWLSSQSHQDQDLSVSDSDLKKLWKGLFYCLWHADKTPNQVALINRLTSLFLSLSPSPLSLDFFRCFLLTLRREWPGIDTLRLDKFYLLIRRFINALFQLMRLRNWDVDVLGEYFGVLERDGLLAEDKLLGNGVNYHLASLFLEELKGVGFPLRDEVVDMILRPFFALMMKGRDKILLGKVKSCLFDELLKMGKELLRKKSMGEDCDGNDGDALLGSVALRMGLSGMFYEVGSSPNCIQGNRKVALGLHEEFLKLEKDMESSGIEVAIPEYRYVVGNDDDVEVPHLVPIEFDEDKIKEAKEGVARDDKKKKKRKKDNGDLARVSDTDNLEPSSGFEKNSLTNDLENDGTTLPLSDTLILNLQKQFEKVAAEMDSETNEDSDSFEIPLISEKNTKRKRINGGDAQGYGNANANETTDDGVDAAATSTDKSAKRVRFALKNNLVWTPKTPLPPESLRLPPSVTPRGSALKKGVAPGPILEMLPALKQRKKKRKKEMRHRLQNPILVKKQKKKAKNQSM